uniref:Cytochrome bd-type quinol oxidase, subunit 2 n=1 Tax=Desulfovibrio sp. U5L TaxID=596152 RepID=I2Q4N9_9BACT
MDGQISLADAWFGILALLLWLYVFTDGYDLGAGILCLHAADPVHREIMAESIDGVWHANQTWLVLLGGVLFGAFPLVYGTVLAALYLPAGFLLFAIMARGIGLEYRMKADNKLPWSRLFGWGSVAVTLAHGFLLGGVLQGMDFNGLHYAGGAFDWFTPFTILVAATFLCLYAFLGAAWLVWKTDGPLQHQSRIWSVRYGAATVGMLVLLAGYIALDGRLGFLVGRPGAGGLGAFFILWLVAAVLCAAFSIRSIGKGGEVEPLVWGALMLVAVFVAFGGSLYPLIVPPRLTIEEAAAPPLMLKIMLWTVGSMLPVIFLYNAYHFRLVRGKVRLEDETH